MIKLEFVSEGFAEILRSDGVREVIEENTEKIAEKANANGGDGGFTASQPRLVRFYKSERWLGHVNASTYPAKRAESEGLALTRAVSK